MAHSLDHSHVELSADLARQQVAHIIYACFLIAADFAGMICVRIG